MIVNVKLLRSSRYGRISDILNIDVSEQQLDALIKYKFVEVRKTATVAEIKEDITLEPKSKKKKDKSK